MKDIHNTIYEKFKKTFRAEPILIQSPARVNLIGEHTDYNGGFVLPAAIDRQIILAMAPNNLERIRLHSTDMEESDFETGLSLNYAKSHLNWPNYILGIVDQLQKRGGTIKGFDCVFGGDIPIGSGLSSSAALEGGVIFGLNALFGLNLSKMEMALIAQKAENQFVGVQCGIMDQFANQHGKTGHVIRIDCRSMDFSYHSFDADESAILLCDTKIHRELTSSEYNVRRKQCEEGISILQDFDPKIKCLRDVSDEILESNKNKMPDVIYKRCRYVLDENQRVLNACSDLSEGDIKSFGKRMYQSHYGLRDLYEVSCNELDNLVEATENLDYVLGSRMMGGGFGGCTINLVEKDRLDEAGQQIREFYNTKSGLEIEIYKTQIGEGTGLVSDL